MQYSVLPVKRAGGKEPVRRRVWHFMERERRPRTRRDPKPRSVVDFTGGPVAGLTLRSTPDRAQKFILHH